VVEDQINDDVDIPVVGLFQEMLEIIHGPVL